MYVIRHGYHGLGVDVSSQYDVMEAVAYQMSYVSQRVIPYLGVVGGLRAIT